MSTHTISTQAPLYDLPRRNMKSWLAHTTVCFTEAVLVLSLLGCATNQPKIEYRIAEIPEPPVINRPSLPVLNINSEMDTGTVIQLHRETIKVLQAWGLELEAALNAYRKKEQK